MTVTLEQVNRVTQRLVTTAAMEKLVEETMECGPEMARNRVREALHKIRHGTATIGSMLDYMNFDRHAAPFAILKRLKARDYLTELSAKA